MPDGMTRRDMLKKEFSSDITGERVLRNEMYFEVRSDAVARICDYLYHTLGSPLILLFATDDRAKQECFRLHHVFEDSADAFIILETDVDAEKAEFSSITGRIPAASWYEREIQDMFGLAAKGHPDPRRLISFEDWPEGAYPLRKDFDIRTKPSRVSGEYVYRRVDGEGVYEIPVGPVHAGVIEPGHFRFSVAGEPILNLEIRHFYTHKGVEKLFESMSIDKSVFLAERVSGDNSAAHAVSLCQAFEKIAAIDVPPRAKYIRTLLLELERIYCHLGDIAGIATDVAYYFGAAHLNRLKERAMALNEAVTGSRLLRGMNAVGGVRRDICGKEDLILAELSFIEKEFREAMDTMFATSSVMDRIENTGRIYTDIAKGLHVVGPVGRASGIDRDTRRDHPYAAYPELQFRVPVLRGGDVNARTRVRADEVYESISLVRQALSKLPRGSIMAGANTIPDGAALGYTEAPRGENVYWVRISGNKIDRCKVRDPSFCNWRSIEYAVLDNIVPDFPIINKSLSLSYSGNDM